MAENEEIPHLAGAKSYDLRLPEQVILMLVFQKLELTKTQFLE